MSKRVIAFLFALILIFGAGCAAKAAQEAAIEATMPPTGAVVKTNGAANPTVTITPENVVDPYLPYTHEMMVRDAKMLAAIYPQYLQISSIGSSVEGRDLTLIMMGSGERKLLLVGAHHAREYISSTYLMNTIDKYVYAAASGEDFGGYDIADLLTKVSVYIVPMINPDGVNLVINGVDSVVDLEAVMSMLMVKSDYAEWKANINGVDLNRQYPCFWEEKASDINEPGSELFKGYSSASEPEVIAMMALCESNEFAIAVSFHTKGEIIYWADSGSVGNIPSAQRVADAVAEVSGYKKVSPSKEPSVYGAGFENWFRQEYSRGGLLVELTSSDGTSTPHEDADFDDIVWEDAKYIVAVLMQQALYSEE